MTNSERKAAVAKIFGDLADRIQASTNAGEDKRLALAVLAIVRNIYDFTADMRDDLAAIRAKIG